MLPNMFLAYIRLIFRGSFVEITAILLVYKILKMPLDVLGYWYLKTILKVPKLKYRAYTKEWCGFKSE
jgi:hypothetical protein